MVVVVVGGGGWWWMVVRGGVGLWYVLVVCVGGGGWRWWVADVGSGGGDFNSKNLYSFGTPNFRGIPLNLGVYP